MGFNIAGIVINKNYSENINALFPDLGIKAEFAEEVSFEEASANWKEEGIYDIYFLDNATLIFRDMESSGKPYQVKDQQVLSFVISETSMMFSFYYTVDQKLIRGIMEGNGNRFVNQGEPLQLESNINGTSELIWNFMEQILGKSYWSIDLEESAFRYQLK